MLSNLPPGVTSLPGDNDCDVSFKSDATFYASIDNESTIPMIDNAIKPINQRYIGVKATSDPIIDEVTSDYTTYHFNVHIIGDTTIDTTMTHDEIVSSIIAYIKHELKGYDIESDNMSIDPFDISYEVHT